MDASTMTQQPEAANERRQGLDIVYFSRNFPEISQTFVFNEMRALRERGARVRVVALRRAAEDASDLPDKFGFARDVTYIGSNGRGPGRLSRLAGTAGALARCGVGFPKALAAAFGAWRSKRLDMPTSSAIAAAALLQPPGRQPVIHCHFGTVGKTVAEMKALGLIDAPMSVVFHGYDVTQYLADKPADTYRTLFEQAEILLPISDLWHRRLLELGAPSQKIRTLRLGIDCDALAFRERGKSPGEPLRFVTIGRMTEKKGHQYTLEAFAALAARRPDLDARLDVIGNGPLFEAAKALADRANLGDRLTLHGGLQHDAVKALLGRAHVFVLPSVTAENGDMEGIPVAIMEAMAMGLAVVSTRHSGIPELVEDGVSGLLLAERDVEALSAAMEALADDPERIVGMGRAGRAIVEERYNERTQAARLYDVLADLRRGTKP